MTRYHGQKNRKGLWIAMAAAAVVVLGAVIWWYPARYDAEPPKLSSSDNWQSPSPSAGGESDGGGVGGESSESASAEASGEPSDVPASEAPSAGTGNNPSDGTPAAGSGDDPASESPAVGGEQTPAPSPSSAGSGEGQGTNPSGGGTAGTTVPDKPSTSGESSAEQRKQIDSKYESRIVSLRSECVGKSQGLLNGMLAEIKGNKDATAELLQGEFLDDLIAAEQSCDSSFQSLLSGAKAEYEKAGIDSALMPNWSAQYEAEKSAARINAIGQLAGALE